MKIQCACGAKFSFDVTPEMAATAVQFVCPTCGLNSTSLVNHLIQQHATGALPKPGCRATTLLPGPVSATAAPSTSAPQTLTPALSAPTGGAPVAKVLTPAPQPAAAAPRVPVAKLLSSPVPSPSPAPAAVPATAVRVVVQDRSASASPPSSEPSAPATPMCTKHFGQVAVNRCFICQKPICPQCMALFGWVCSPLCKNKAESQGIAIPEYEGLNSVADRREWRKVGRNALAIAGGVAFVLGIWIWYAWFGSAPRVSYSARFSEPASSGQLYPGSQKQFIVLHGGTLARIDGKTKREVWSVPLIDKRKLADQAAASYQFLLAARKEAIAQGVDADDLEMPVPETVDRDMVDLAASSLKLHVAGNNIWVESPEKLVQYDWETGKAGKELLLDDEADDLSRHGNEFLRLAHNNSGTQIIRINLMTGETRTETVTDPAAMLAAAGNVGGSPRAATNAVSRGKGPTNQLARAGVSSNLLARVGLRPGARNVDPAAIARLYQNMPVEYRLALPATLAASANQQRLRAALNDRDPVEPGGLLGEADLPEGDELRVIPTRDGYLEFGSRLIERRIVSRKVMKAPPTKSALDGPINQAATAAIANELLNEMTRETYGDTVKEDESRYQVTLRRPGAPDWTGEVIGRPGLIPVDSVDLVTGLRSIIVFDKHNKKLWETKLASDLHGGSDFDFNSEGPAGAGPAVERGDTLYLYDATVLTAFERATGNARWRLPSVGITGLFFDEKGMIYVNTSTASPDRVRYSRQIDVTEKTRTLVIKVDPQTGKSFWRAENDGQVAYISGKYVYTVEAARGMDIDGVGGVKVGARIPPHIRIKRLKPSNGRVLWEHYEMRSPLDYHFEGNEIQILFRKELEVLRFFTL